MQLVFDTDVLIALSCGSLFNHVEEMWPECLVATESVADELHRKVQTSANLNCGRYPLGLSWVRTPAEFTERDQQKIEIHRMALAGPTAHQFQHAGEAEILYYCSRISDSIAVLNDRDARARAKLIGIPYWDSITIVKKLVAAGRIDCQDAFTAYERMGRESTMPHGLSARDFCVAGCTLH